MQASKIINTCVMLHNFCLEYNVPPPYDYENHDIWDFGVLPPLPPNDDGNDELAAGRQIRQQIIRNYFS